MNRETVMISAALAAMEFSLELVAADEVLVVTDRKTGTCGKAFALAAEQLGCHTRIFWLPENDRPLTALPDGLLDLLPGTTVVVNAVDGDAREVPFRMEWIRAIDADPQVRLGHSPGIDEDMMLHGPLNIDYAAMGKLETSLLATLRTACSLRITTEAGTDLTLDVTDRDFISDLKATPKTGVNMPCGEVYCAPVEDGAGGVLVVDGCFGSEGPVASPVTMTLVQGRVVDVACDDSTLTRTINGLLDTDEGARTIAELGIGLNPGARLTERMLEAEKVNGTAHIAFGSNEGMPGGRSISRMHIDYLFHRPTITASDSAGRGWLVLANGKPA